MSIIYTLSQDVYHVYAEFEIKKKTHISPLKCSFSLVGLKNAA